MLTPHNYFLGLALVTETYCQFDFNALENATILARGSVVGFQNLTVQNQILPFELEADAWLGDDRRRSIRLLADEGLFKVVVNGILAQQDPRPPSLR